MDRETAIITQSIRFRKEGAFFNVMSQAVGRFASSASRRSSGYRLVETSVATFVPMFPLLPSEVERLFTFFEANPLFVSKDLHGAKLAQAAAEPQGLFLNIYQKKSPTDFLLVRVTPSSFVPGRALSVARARPLLIKPPKPRSVEALDKLRFDAREFIKKNEAVKSIDDKLQNLSRLSLTDDEPEQTSAASSLAVEDSAKPKADVVSIFKKTPPKNPPLP